MLGADEDGGMLFLHSELLIYIFKCKWNRGTAQFLENNFEICSIYSQESLLQRKFKYDDEVMKI